MEIDINKYRQYQKVLKEIHMAQSKNYPSFKQMVKELQKKAYISLEN